MAICRVWAWSPFLGKERKTKRQGRGAMKCFPPTTHNRITPISHFHPPILSLSLSLTSRANKNILKQGASAVLCYSTLSSPLAQPRPLILGHLLAALTSIALTKFFLLLPSATFTRLEPLLGALATGLAIVFMQATGTVHPPAGATALLAAVDKDVRGLGWFLVPVTGVCGGVVLVSACLVGNLQRRWPVFWWVAGDVDGWVEEGEGDVGERGERGNGDGGDGGEKGLVREGKGDGGEKGLVVRGDCRREVSDNLDGGGNAVSAKGEGSRSSVTLGRGHGERGS